MSHYTVAVLIPPDRVAPADESPVLVEDDVNEIVEEALARFDEQREVEPYSDPLNEVHLAFLVKLACEQGLLLLPEGIDAQPEGAGAIARWIETLTERVGIGALLEACSAVSHDEQLHLDSSGRIAQRTTSNPDGRWDWYTVGGRWSGKFDPDRNRNVLRIGEIDWTNLDRRARIDAGTEWDRLSSEAPERIGNTTRDEYVDAVAPTYLPTAALLTADGEWREPSRIGWFGTSYNETMSESEWAREWSERVREADPDTVLVLVDCHV